MSDQFFPSIESSIDKKKSYNILEKKKKSEAFEFSNNIHIHMYKPTWLSTYFITFYKIMIY